MYKYGWKVTNWDKLKVGDIVQIRTENKAEANLSGSKLTPDIPADLLILATRLLNISHLLSYQLCLRKLRYYQFLSYD